MKGFKRAFKAESLAVIIHGLYEKEIATKMDSIPEKVLRDAFFRMHSKRHVRQLISYTKSGIDSLYKRLQNGETFEQLAQTCFRDSVLSSNGGDIGLVSWGDMDIDFENAVFNLNIGEISHPIETKYGWHIIKVENEYINPIAKQSEYEARRKTILERTRYRLLKNESDNQIKKLMANKHISMNLPLIKVLQTEFNRIQNQKEFQLQPATAFAEHLSTDLSEKYWNEPIAYYDNSKWTVADFYAYLPTINPASIQKGVYAAVSMSLRNHFLLQEAKKKHIDKEPRVQEKLLHKKEHLLSYTYINAIADTFQISAKDHIKYYQQNKNIFLIDKEMTVYQIFLKDQKTAYALRSQITNFDSFLKTAGTHSLKPVTEKTINRNDGPLGEFCYKQPVESVGGPVKTKDGYSLIWIKQAINIYKSFSDVQDEIAERIEQDREGFVFQLLKKKYAYQPQNITFRENL